ncbi:Hsp20/alpha crystallin family protein [Opitutaceae bacterium TAV4]|nr:Hsp20/alpha crystallin family protein [Opitutaceae bacterium TAV4]RRK00679.1 Hsp20/alpha crystallin family protein [Opitutaceae bacterium TAV3]
MHTIIHPLKPASRFDTTDTRPTADSRKPHYDCTELADAVALSVFLPNVEPIGVEFTVRGPDLILTARKRHIVRVNWRAAHLESAEHDYELHLRLGRGLDYDALRAEIDGDLLRVVIPKRMTTAEELRAVAA